MTRSEPRPIGGPDSLAPRTVNAIEEGDLPSPPATENDDTTGTVEHSFFLTTGYAAPFGAIDGKVTPFAFGGTFLPFLGSDGTPAAELAARIGPELRHIWRFNIVTQTWDVYRAIGHTNRNTLHTLNHGDALFIRMLRQGTTLTFELPIEPEPSSETVLLVRGWTSVMYRGPYGVRASELLDDLPPGSKALVSHGNIARWGGATRRDNGWVHPIGGEPFLLAHLDVVFVENAGDVPVEITLPRVSPDKAFVRTDLGGSCLARVTARAFHASAANPVDRAVLVDLQQQTDSADRAIFVSERADRWWIEVSVAAEYEELRALEFVPSSQSSSGRLLGRLPVDRLVDAKRTLGGDIGVRGFCRDLPNRAPVVIPG